MKIKLFIAALLLSFFGIAHAEKMITCNHDEMMSGKAPAACEKLAQQLAGTNFKSFLMPAKVKWDDFASWSTCLPIEAGEKPSPECKPYTNALRQGSTVVINRDATQQNYVTDSIPRGAVVIHIAGSKNETDPCPLTDPNALDAKLNEITGGDHKKPVIFTGEKSVCRLPYNDVALAEKLGYNAAFFPVAETQKPDDLVTSIRKRISNIKPW